MDQRKHFYISLSVYFILAVILYPLFKFNINPDGIVYISVAKKYIALNFDLAINGSWGPLLSIIFIPAMLLNIEPVFYIKFINIGLGILLFLSGRRLIYSVKPGKDIETVFYYAMIIPALYFTYWVISPDFLLLNIFLIYIILALKEDFLENYKNAIFLGITGALLYYTKSYGFPFFLLHFLIFTLIKVFSSNKGNRRMILKNGVITLLLFGSLSGIWVLALHSKYDKWGFSSANTLFYSQIAPGANMVHEYINNKIVAPPDSMSLCANEDPSLYKMREWSPFNSAEDLIYYSGIVIKNVYRLAERLILFTPLLVLLFVPFIFKRLIRDRKILLLLLSMLLYSSGYLMLFVETRYIWQIIFLGMIVTAKIVSDFIQKYDKIPVIKKGIPILLILSFIPISIYGMGMKVNYGKEEHELAQEIKKVVPESSKVATDSEWLKILYVSYYNKLYFYGNSDTSLRDNEFQQELKRYGIDYFFVWNKEMQEPGVHLPGSKFKNLRIYQVNK